MRTSVDLAERVFLLSLTAAFLYRFIPHITLQPYDIVLMISEIVTVTMVLIRKSGDCAIAPYPIALGFFGTAAPLLVMPVGQPLVDASLSGGVMFAGLTISLAAKVFLNRSWGLVAANRGVKVRGPYRFVRHPMYAGYIMIHAGFLLSSFSIWNAVVYVLAWLLLILRISEEEKFLSLDAAYQAYSTRVRYRLLPGVF